METKCIVKKIVFNDNTELQLSPNDIVIFVGANNCGKSQSLKDINKAFIDPTHNVVVKHIEFENSGAEFFEDSIKNVSSFNKENGQYSGYGYSIHSGWIGHLRKNTFSGLEQLKSFFVKMLDTRERLYHCDPVSVIDRDEPKTHPLHYLANSSDLREKIDNSFYEAFGEHLQIERYSGRSNFLRIGNKVMRLAGENVTLDEDLDNATKVLDTYPKLHEQGDGMVGFTGVLLSLLIDNYSVFLIDEPEAFLHPPQARILGTEIPELLGNRQAFLSTHSEHMLKGLLEVAQDRIKVVRITRRGNINNFSIIDNADISKIWKDTLLRQSNVLQGLFYDTVVVCESDSDCQFYSAIQNYIKEMRAKRDNSFFVYSSTKNRMKIIVEALRPLSVEYRVIADLDILREEKDVKSLFESCGGNWEDISDSYMFFSEALKDENNTINKEELKKLCINIIDADGRDEFDKTSLQAIKQKISLEHKWKTLKDNGIKVLPKDAASVFAHIDDLLKKYKIFLVPCGELEGFVDVSGHGPSWVANVMERFPDFGLPIYDEARKFVESWRI